MSDTDDDIIDSNVFHNENTFLHGPDSVRGRMLSSTAYNPLFSKNPYRDNERSFYHRREKSPIAMQSVPDFEERNLNQPYYRREMSCERYGRSQSVASVRSIDSSASVSFHIAELFKNTKFTKYDKKIVNEAYKKYFKRPARRRAGKRRKLKLYLKHNQHKSGNDSGEEGSDSSVSSDGGRSVRSVRSIRSVRSVMSVPHNILRPSSMSNRSEIINFHATMKESNMYKDCTANLKQNTFNTICNSSNIGDVLVHSNVNKKNAILHDNKSLNGTLKERFAKGFMLPSQRFSQPVTRLMSMNNMKFGNNSERSTIPDDKSVSENEEIFPSENSISQNNVCRKRNREINDIESSKEKRIKGFPSNHNVENTTVCNITKDNDFTFKVPKMPIQKNKIYTITKLKGGISTDIPRQVPPVSTYGQSTSFLESVNGNNLNKSKWKVNGFLHIRNTVYKKPEEDNDKEEMNHNNTSDTVQTNCIVSQKSQNIVDTDDGDKNKKRTTRIVQKENINAVSNIKKSELKSKSDMNSKELQVLQENDSGTNIEKHGLNSEKLISKSLQPLVGNVEVMGNNSKSHEIQKIQTNPESRSLVNNSQMQMTSSDLSMRPSFIKRKLFTQKLDVVEDKNLSSDNVNSPQIKSYNFREKNKARKLTTSHCCLSRDVTTGEENILDLIHKIVPADKMNMTSVSNKRTVNNYKSEVTEKFDTTSVICNDGNESDTFTDEEIFKLSNSKISNRNEGNNNTKIERVSHCNVVVQRLQTQNIEKFLSKENDTESKFTTKRTVSSCVRTFWDTDFESDVEDIKTPLKSTRNRIIHQAKLKEQETTKPIEKKSSCKPTLEQNKNNNSTIKPSATTQNKISEKRGITDKNSESVVANSKLNSKTKSKNNAKEKENDPVHAENNKTITKYLRKHNRDSKIYLDDSLNSSLNDHSYLTRSLRLKKKQLVNDSCKKNTTSSRTIPKPDHTINKKSPKAKPKPQEIAQDRQSKEKFIRKRAPSQRKSKQIKVNLNLSALSNSSYNMTLRSKSR